MGASGWIGASEEEAGIAEAAGGAHGLPGRTVAGAGLMAPPPTVAAAAG